MTNNIKSSKIFLILTPHNYCFPILKWGDMLRLKVKKCDRTPAWSLSLTAQYWGRRCCLGSLSTTQMQPNTCHDHPPTLTWMPGTLRGEIGALRMTGKPWLWLSVKWREARDLDGLFTGPFSVPGSLPSSRYLPSYLKTQKNEIVQTSLSEDYNKVIGKL